MVRFPFKQTQILEGPSRTRSTPECNQPNPNQAEVLNLSSGQVEGHPSSGQVVPNRLPLLLRLGRLGLGFGPIQVETQS